MISSKRSKMDLEYVKSLELRIVELQAQVDELKAQKNKQTMMSTNQGTLANPFAPYTNWTDYHNNLTYYEKSQYEIYVLKHRNAELQTQVNHLQAQKDKRTMLKMRQFGSLAEGLTQFRMHLKLMDVIMYKWYDAYMNGDMDALISELLNDRQGYCDIKDCRDCDKGIALECASCQEDWE